MTNPDHEVERVARAIYGNFWGPPGAEIRDTLDNIVEFTWDQATATAQEAMRRMARAAIAAMQSKASEPR